MIRSRQTSGTKDQDRLIGAVPLSAFGQSEHGLQKDVGANLKMLRLGELARIVADTSDARHEDHCGGTDLRHHLGIVAGARSHSLDWQRAGGAVDLGGDFYRFQYD